MTNPTVAGFYFCREPGRQNAYEDLVPPREIGDHCQKLGIPLYEIIKGEPYRVELDERGETAHKEQVTPEKIAAGDFKISEEQRMYAKEAVFHDSPFRFIPQEAFLVDSAGEGRSTYAALALQSRNKKDIKREKMPYRRISNETGLEIKEETEVTLLAQFPRLGSSRELFLVDGKLFERTTSVRGSRGNFPVEVNHRRIERTSYVWIGQNTYDLERFLTGIHAYLEGMREAVSEGIQRHEEKSRKWEQNEKENENVSRFWDGVRKLLAARLYGFGMQAEASGDTETKEKAFAIANQVMSLEEYKSVESRRVDAHGRIKLTDEDFAR